MTSCRDFELKLGALYIVLQTSPWTKVFFTITGTFLYCYWQKKTETTLEDTT